MASNAVIENGLVLLSLAAAGWIMVRPHRRRPDVKLTRAWARIREWAQTSGSWRGTDSAADAECMGERPMASIVLVRLMLEAALYGLSSGGSDADRALPCNSFADLLPLRLRRIPRGTTSSAAAVLR